MTEVLPGIHRIRLPLGRSRLRHINSYLIKGDDGYVLVDCGWDTVEVLEALQSALRELSVGLEDVRRLVVTHFHADHYGLAGTLARLGQLRLLMHRLDWLYIRTHLTDFSAAVRETTGWLERNGLRAPVTDDEKHAREGMRRYTVIAPDTELEDAERIEVGGHTLQVVWTPGHTPGHICLYDAGRQLLLSGDHVLDPITPNVSLSRPGLGNPLGDYLASLRKVAALRADLVLPAHGQPFRGLRRRVEELLAHHDEREAAALEAVSHGGSTGAEVAQRLPWTRRHTKFSDLPTFQQGMALAETLSHLEELRANGLISRSERKGRIYYQRTSAAEASPAAGSD